MNNTILRGTNTRARAGTEAENDQIQRDIAGGAWSGSSNAVIGTAQVAGHVIASPALITEGGREFHAELANQAGSIMSSVEQTSAETLGANPKSSAFEVSANFTETVTPLGGSARSTVSRRRAYLGKTPGKQSRTGREVLDRMMQEGRVRETSTGIEIQAPDGSWHQIEKTDMSHLYDAVKYWNETGKYHGPRSREVREWMRDSDNYELESSSANRSRGGKTKDRYEPPEKMEKSDESAK